MDKTVHHRQADGKHILIAVDESDNAMRAVKYVADLLGGVEGFRVTLLSIVPDPAEDYFAADKDRRAWTEGYRTQLIAVVERARLMLIGAGFGQDKVDEVIDSMYCPSVAECIMSEQRKLNSSAIVVGRRGISKREEIIFGSTSIRILHEARNCAVWVVE